MKTPILLRYLLVILLPLGLVLWNIIAPASERTDHFINGIIMACAATFLFKFVLVSYIMAHLRQDKMGKQHALWQGIPIVLFIIYIIVYFIK